MENEKMMADLQLLNWIRNRNHEGYTVEEEDSGNTKCLHLKTPYADGFVRINYLEFVIAEYIITSQSGEQVFYLHFELTDFEHARDLYTELETCLLNQKGRRRKQILLCCTCGLTTSYFAMRLNEVADLLNADMEFSALPYEQLYENASDKDAVLIAPQMGHRLNSVKEVITDRVVMNIPVAMFSMYDAVGVIDRLKEEFRRKDEENAQAENSGGQNLPAQENGSVLIVSVVYMEGRNQIAYRLYEGSRAAHSSQITKQTYSLTDILDVIHTVKLLNPDLKKICIVTPGMIREGRLTYESVHISDYDLVGKVKEDFSGEVYLFNDTDMITLGYAKKHCPKESCAFYFVPTGNYAGNIGIAVGGRLIHGTGHMGGRQLEAVTDITAFPRNPYALQRTPEGNAELAARYLTGLFCYTGISHIAFYSKMIVSAEILKNKMEEFIPAQYLPKISKCESTRDYLYDGALASMQNQED